MNRQVNRTSLSPWLRALRISLAVAWIAAVVALWLGLRPVAAWLLEAADGAWPVMVVLGWLPLGGLLVYVATTVALGERTRAVGFRRVWWAVGYLWTIAAAGALPGRFTSTRAGQASDLAAGGPGLVAGYDAGALALLASLVVSVVAVAAVAGGPGTERRLPRARPSTVLAASISVCPLVALVVGPGGLSQPAGGGQPEPPRSTS